MKIEGKNDSFSSKLSTTYTYENFVDSGKKEIWVWIDTDIIYPLRESNSCRHREKVESLPLDERDI